MEVDAIKAKIEAAIAGAEVTVTGDGSHFDARVISDEFAGKTPVQKQKMVYAPLNELITSGELHALTIKAYTPAEWEKAKKLQVMS
ncbi:MAG: BolA family transcriptional regulator [Gammaproteobacteria bacterium]|nr:BolA family transcriptional regulator [Gammaproteobacteria bacterium]